MTGSRCFGGEHEFALNSSTNMPSFKYVLFKKNLHFEDHPFKKVTNIWIYDPIIPYSN